MNENKDIKTEDMKEESGMEPETPETAGQGIPETGKSPAKTAGSSPEGGISEEGPRAESKEGSEGGTGRETDADASGETSEEIPQEAPKAEPDEDLQTRFLRLSADFQNYRRRSENEKKDIYAYANEKIAVQLLEVLDNFERALSAGCTDEKFLSGMQLIFRQMQDLLAKNNIEEIDALGKEFDPNFHHAVMTEASDQPSGTVTKVFQKGYTLNNKVIRPAMVAVAE